MQLETGIRTDPVVRADRFVAPWQELEQQTQSAYTEGRTSDYHSIRKSVGAMAQSIGRAAQLESVLAGRKQ